MENVALIIGVISGVCAIINFVITHFHKRNLKELKNKINVIEQEISVSNEMILGDSYNENKASNHSVINNGNDNKTSIVRRGS